MAKVELNGFILTTLTGLVLCYEENCDYLDTNHKDNTNWLQCHENGCCGEFTDRYCCRGPIVTVAIIFGVLIGTLILTVIVAVCYTKLKKKQMHRTRVIPTIVAKSYSDIPLPSPVRAPPVYNTARLHPPAFTPQPFKNLRSSFDRDEVHPPPSNLHPPRLHILR